MKTGQMPNMRPFLIDVQIQVSFHKMKFSLSVKLVFIFSSIKAKTISKHIQILSQVRCYIKLCVNINGMEIYSLTDVPDLACTELTSVWWRLNSAAADSQKFLGSSWKNDRKHPLKTVS